MGNRGCLHDDRQRIIRPFQTRRWIACRLQFKGRRRPIMTPGRYTELFFWDEATALAAGHRPCAECRRDDYNGFREALVRGNPGIFGAATPTAAAMDGLLHGQRVRADGSKVTYLEELSHLPDGCFVSLGPDSDPTLVWQGMLLAWSPNGYHSPTVLPGGNSVVRVITPYAIVQALGQAYRGHGVPFVRLE